MRSLFAVLWTLLLSAFGFAQQRTAAVSLDDGRVLHGRVIAMDLKSLQIQVGTEVLTIPTASINTCHIETVPEDPATATPGLAEPVREASPGAAQPPRRPVVVVVPAALDESELDEESLPHDRRNRSLWQQRIEAFDAMYPWLAPAAPTQWISLGLLLFAGLSLFVHLSTWVGGADSPAFGRAMAIALWYVVSGLLQVAFVPARDVAVVIMLTANTTLALFLMRASFGLTRSATVVALAVQLGLVTVAYGVLTLVDAVLASLGSSPS